MNYTHSELWQDIHGFQIDRPEATLRFSDRLARQNGWKLAFAGRVVEEYKRFVFLAMVAEHEVTPSDEVDEAWHLHLTYTRSYWDGLCREVLQRPLHHVPTRGGRAERARHIAQYEQTLATYKSVFGHSPPTDIWPPAKERFARNASHVRVNRREAWVLPKPTRLWFTSQANRRGKLAAFAAVVPLMVGVVNPLDLTGPQFLVFYGLMSAVAILAAFVLRQTLRGDGQTSDTPLTPFETACLNGGVPNLLRACLAMLVVDRRLQLVPTEKVPTFVRVGAESASDHDIERNMLRAASHENGASAAELLNAARPAAERLQSELQGRGLMESTASFSAARWWPLTILGLVLLLGVLKFLVGLQRGKPVIYLVFMNIGLLALMLLYFWRMPLRTRRGNELLRQLKNQNHRLQSIELRSSAASAQVPASSDLLLAAGLFGLAALHHPDVTAINRSLKPVSDTTYSSGGCGATTGCGGGGGGCGGGGCGGGGCGGCGGD